MIGARIDPQFREHLPAEGVPRKHAANGRANDTIGMSRFEQFADGDLLDSALVSRVAVVGLLFALSTAESDLLGIHDDHVVADVCVRSELRLVLSAQDGRDSCRESTQDQIFGVHNVPAVFDLFGTHASRCGKGSIGHFE